MLIMTILVLLYYVSKTKPETLIIQETLAYFIEQLQQISQVWWTVAKRYKSPATAVRWPNIGSHGLFFRGILHVLSFGFLCFGYFMLVFFLFHFRLFVFLLCFLFIFCIWFRLHRFSSSIGFLDFWSIKHC